MENGEMSFIFSRCTHHVSRIAFYVLCATFYVCLLFFTFSERPAYSQSQVTLQASYRDANAAYENGQYQQAVERYEQIVGSIRNGVVHYNLGNAYFRLGKRGKAILNYERAKRLMPRDKDTSFNLKVARTRNIDQFDLVQPSSGFSLLYGILHPTEIVWIGLIPYWIAAVSVVLIQFTQHRPFRRALRYVALVGGIVWLSSLLLLGLKIRHLHIPHAIITADEVVVRSEPDSRADTIALPLHEGTKVQVQQEHRDWIQIYLADEGAGWLPTEAIERI